MLVCVPRRYKKPGFSGLGFVFWFRRSFLQETDLTEKGEADDRHESQ